MVIENGNYNYMDLLFEQKEKVLTLLKILQITKSNKKLIITY